MFGLFKLRAVVVGFVRCNGSADPLGRNLKIPADSYGHQHVIEVVAANQMSFHGMNFPLLLPVED